MAKIVTKGRILNWERLYWDPDEAEEDEEEDGGGESGLEEEEE